MKYRKKPVVIEAKQWLGNNFGEIQDFCKDCDGFCMVTGPNVQIEECGKVGNKQSLTIETLEGCMTARQGSYIIKGIKGEFYACDETIFNLTYEVINESIDQPGGSSTS